MPMPSSSTPIAQVMVVNRKAPQVKSGTMISITGA